MSRSEPLDHVYWIGGGSGSGKSTVARRIAAQHCLRLYATDDAMAEHAGRATPQDSPFLSEFVAMDMDQRWVERSPQTMLETFHWCSPSAWPRRRSASICAIEVDTTTAEDDLVDAVIAAFGL